MASLRIDTSLGVAGSGEISDIVARARKADALGFDALWTSETQHDPFLPLALAAEHTSRLSLGTAIAVAFARSPMTLASQAWDLQKMSRGRFILGLGTQVKAHIERRFGMTWDHPAPRLREYVRAIRAIWQAWQTGEPLNFRGEFFKLTLMSPFFNPGPIECPNIPIFVAGVNDQLCKVAGEVCDGFHVHPFHTPKYIAEFILPNLEAGLAKTGRNRNDVTLASSVFVIVGDTPDERARARALVRQQISFYASTPTYHPVFELHGWKPVAERLTAVAARGKWTEMPALVTDEILSTFAAEGTWAEMPGLLKKRYAGLLDRLMYYLDEGDEVKQALTVRGFSS